MSGRHHALYIATEGRLHGLAPESKVAATVAFIFAVVATPREAVWAFAVDLCIVFAVAAIGGVPIGHLVRRLTIEIPFLLFAVFLPFVGRPPNVEVLGLSLSEAGLWAAFGIVVKGSLGVLATVVLASTTSIPDILAGLERLRVPQVLVAITAFMIRYGDVADRRSAADARRARVTRRRPALDLAGPGRRLDRRDALRPFVRAWRAGAPGDAGPRLRGLDAAIGPHVLGRDGLLRPGRGGHRRRRCRLGGPMTAATDRAPVAEIVDLRFRYPDGTLALDGVDLAIQPGERLAILGPNGAGKSTLVLHLNGIHTPTSGRVTIDGLPVDRANRREIRRRVGIVFQDPDDQLFMPTVRHDVAFGPANLGLRGDELEARVVEALEAVGMTDVADRSPHHLSFGQRRRVAVATVLAMRPALLVLDEPSSNLDPRAAARARRRSSSGLSIAMVIVTHDLPYALQLCDSAVVMNEGRITARGVTAELLADTATMAANRLELPFGFTVPGARPRSST